ncbi:FtsK/SpoIIIE family DNA translocase [Aureimonas leprariae]|uniref:DNA translocase FtsK n=1 Tax=Plantimonas leprariae TaxID=2615207 RepID=A0A7V7PRP9_9HYPH|nr:DNA translocase FtsK 4TM domain-containing protein [Aureimonas leprariae]KAB0681455.1 DNA translocase FtsK [Aureimonas leprariae]
MAVTATVRGAAVVRGAERRAAPAPLETAEAPGFLKRQGQIAGGAALVGLGLWLAFAFATWNVADPSWSQANGNAVANWMGAAGAVAADLALQCFGLAAALVALLPLVWGVLLARGRPTDRLGRRAWLALAGAVLAAAALGCVPAPAGWPLPIGLGGVAGDIVLKLPASATGAYPSGALGIALALMLSAPAAWLFLNGAGLLDRADPAAAAARRAAEAESGDDEDGDGRLALVFGAMAHLVYSAKAAFARRRAEYESKRREPGEFADRFRDWHDEADAAPRPVATPAAPASPQREIRVAAPYRGGFVDPLGDEGEAPEKDAPDRFQFDAPPAAPRRAPAAAAFEPASEEAEDDDFAGDEPPFAMDEREFAPIGQDEDDDRLVMRADDRVTDAPRPEEAAAGGWFGGIAANIVAFPGKRKGKSEPEASPRGGEGYPRAAAARAPAAPARPAAPEAPGAARVVAPAGSIKPTSAQSLQRAAVAHAPLREEAPFELPPLDLLTPPKAKQRDATLSPEALQENARLLEGVLDDFSVKGEIIEVRPGPVVTLYELEPAPGIKSSRVIGLADDIARSMSAIAARVAVIPGKNAIGIELPNTRRETVYFREMIASETFSGNKGKLPLALGKTIGGEPVIADLAKMPHLLVAGTTGSGKSVSINTMILSLLYRMTPAECRMIMIDPKMLELSIYDGIPHLLAPVVTDPKKAVVALKWTVREMEDRYRKMSKLGVRNIDGFNQRLQSAMEKGETISRTVQTGFDRETGEPVFESEEFDLSPLPYIVVVIDEMADLMMVAGKEIEGTVQRLAQMARAAGIHVIMATQRPSVDVITGTIKANFPTRISFQVTSKIDSRTILQEQGAEQLLGQGDMLFMAGGGRIQRVHGPFVADEEVEGIVRHLKSQGVPEYLDSILEEEDEDGGSAPSGKAGKGGEAAGGGDDLSNMEESADLYDQAVAVVLRDGKASTSYVQRRLQIGYNRAASIIERMEREGIVGPANHAGKREILVPTEEDRM